jgi:hypothetical protein
LEEYMNVELSRDEIRTLLESLDYSLQRVGASQGTPRDVKQQNLKRLEVLKEKLVDVLRGGE